MAGNAALAERSAAHLSPVLARYFQRGWVRGEGHRLWDADGKEYLDFACGLAVTILGHAHPRVTAAIHAQADRLLHMCNGLGYLEPVTALADALAATFPSSLDSVFFANSGAEAIEAAVKLARRVTGRPAIIGFSGGFHGRTYAPLSLTTSNLNYRVGPRTVPAGHLHLTRSRACTAASAAMRRPRSTVRSSRSARCSASRCRRRRSRRSSSSPSQGEGGYDPAPAAFMQGLREIADQHGILLIADEIQTGLGRTGRMWGFEHAGIVPDVVTLAKGIANGLPLSAIVASSDSDAPLGRRCPRLDVRWQSRLVRGRCGRAATRSARSGWSRTRPPGAPSSRQACRRSRPRTHASVTCGARAHDRRRVRERPRDPRAGRRHRGCAHRALRGPGLLLLTCGTYHNVVRWIAPLDVTRRSEGSGGPPG